MNKLIRLDANEIGALATNYTTFETKAVSTVEKIMSQVPEDLKTIDVISGDAMEQQVMAVYSAIDDKAKSLKSTRLEITRILDDVKKQFTSSESKVAENLAKIKGFAEKWNAEKLRRKKAEEEAKEAERLKKQQDTKIQNEVLNYFLELSLKTFTEIKEKTETTFYSCKSADEVNLMMSKIKEEITEEKVKSIFSARREKKPYIFTDPSEFQNMEEIIAKVEADEKKYIDKFLQLCRQLIEFAPTQIEKIKKQNEAEKQAELKKLKQKQADEVAKLEAEMKAKAEAEAQAKAMEGLNSELAAATPAIEMTKGASVKMKYDCQNHAELLKIVQWYLHNSFLKEEFESLNTKLSFMRASADKALNDTGEVIEGVTTKEDVRIRKTKNE